MAEPIMLKKIMRVNSVIREYATKMLGTFDHPNGCKAIFKNKKHPRKWASNGQARLF